MSISWNCSDDIFTIYNMFCIDRVVIARGPHPIPSRTRSLSLSAPMVLCLKARESRSPPGLYKTCHAILQRRHALPSLLKRKMPYWSANRAFCVLMRQDFEKRLNLNTFYELFSQISLFPRVFLSYAKLIASKLVHSFKSIDLCPSK